MPAALTTADARLLVSAGPRRGLRRLAGWTIFATGLLVVALNANLAPVLTCTEARPCGHDVLGAVAVGLVLTSLLLGWLLPWAAAAAAALGAAGQSWWDSRHPAEASPVGTRLLIAYAVVALACAWLATRRPRSEAVELWAGRTGSVTLPTLAEGPRTRPGLVRRVLGLLLIAAGAGLGWYATAHQQEMDAQQRTAQVVTTVVDGHVDEFTLRVRRTGGEPFTIPVLDVASYPVGSELRLAVNGQGLRQPLTEPYDGTGWHALAAGLVFVGGALWWRGRRRREELRAPLTGLHPASGVFVNWRGDLFAGDARTGDAPIASLDVLDYLPAASAATETRPTAPTPLDEDEDDDFDDDQEVGDLDTVEARVLYGAPVIGQLCVVADEQRHLVTVVRVVPVRSAASFTALADGAPPVPDAAAAPARSAPARSAPVPADRLALIPDAEVAAPPELVHRHHKPRLLGLLLTVSMPLALAEVIRLLPRTGAWIAAVAATVVCCFVGYRIWLRAAVAWNAGGVAITGIIGGFTAPWPEVTDITVEGDIVHVISDRHGAASVTAQAKRGGRTAESLRAGLDHARSRFTPTVAPPARPSASPPWALLLLAPVPVAILVAFNAFGHS
ncbi:hypothetical protein F4553_000448 [Allocatelliglobosispora scoriae]|uniref:Uncharacterized protein n=1 Tax=Allocatelliglobosispora scoriae TaxID=643052 RepID=A0A841BIS5_9ACTN|nr:hypothetical protein [Allocatelliglobosispora scoriae]MBB5867069.1 hypothetical protein [Allocatelliglobosispora scoriae]